MHQTIGYINGGREYLKSLIASEPEKFALGRSDKEHVRFGVKEWDSVEILNRGEANWDSRILWFQFDKQVSSLKLRLIAGPGPSTVRQKLLNLALAENDVLRAIDRNIECQLEWNLQSPHFYLSLPWKIRAPRASKNG